jgi:hypothetical protein
MYTCTSCERETSECIAYRRAVLCYACANAFSEELAARRINEDSPYTMHDYNGYVIVEQKPSLAFYVYMRHDRVLDADGLLSGHYLLIARTLERAKASIDKLA